VEQQVGLDDLPRVARKDATRWCGRSRTNPTVSVSTKARRSSSATRRVVASSVSNGRSAAGTAAPARRFRMVDLPAFV
jgi:hypothetical protein